MASRDNPPSAAPNESYADWDETASGRRPGDDPFLPEEGFFWWLPRAALGVLLLFLAGYLITSTVNRGKYQLVLDDEGNAQLQRGQFAPSGWTPFVPDGAVEAWAPVRWPDNTVEAPLDGELVDLADTFLGFLRASASRNLEDDQVLDRLGAQEEKYESWYGERWDASEFPQAENVKEQRAARDNRRAEAAAAAEAAKAAAERQRAEQQAIRVAEAEEQARRAAELSASGADRVRNYATRRRQLIREAEAMLNELPEDMGSEQGRDRQAIEKFIDSMNTPVDFR